MNKKLKIQFWKAEHAMAIQVLEHSGLANIHDGVLYGKTWKLNASLNLNVFNFNSNADRDEYLKNVIRWISEEQFGKDNEGMLKSGELCEVRDDKSACWNRRRLIAILPEKHYFRYITECVFDDRDFNYWKYARPITKRTEPKVEECGQLITYTWEEK